MTFRFGDYELEALLAQGGMGQVFRATRRSLQGFTKPVALKLMLPTIGFDLDFVGMFVDEAKLAASLVHPNIVQVYDLGSVNGRYFIAMEYVDGADLGSLRDALARHGERIPANVVVFLLGEILNGLAHAHDKHDASGAALDIVHRDVSPQNVLVSRDGLVKITDFGIAKVVGRESKTVTGMVRGRVHYMSPEQALGQAVDRRTDIFATAVIGYELLSGKRSYEGADDFEVMAKARTGDIAPLREVAPEIDARLAEVIHQALAPQRDQRFATAAEFARALETAMPMDRRAAAHRLAELVARVADDLRKPEALDASIVPTLVDEKTERTGVGAEAKPRRRAGVISAALVAMLTAGIAWWSTTRHPTLVPIVTAAPTTPGAPSDLPQAPPASAPASAPTLPVHDERKSAPGFLSVNSRPWSHVIIDGKKSLDTPLTHVPLSTGTHHLRLVSPELHREKELHVEIRAGRTTTQLVTF